MHCPASVSPVCQRRPPIEKRNCVDNRFTDLRRFVFTPSRVALTRGRDGRTRSRPKFLWPRPNRRSGALRRATVARVLAVAVAAAASPASSVRPTLNPSASLSGRPYKRAHGKIGPSSEPCRCGWAPPASESQTQQPCATLPTWLQILPSRPLRNRARPPVIHLTDLPCLSQLGQLIAI